MESLKAKPARSALVWLISILIFTCAAQASSTPRTFVATRLGLSVANLHFSYDDPSFSNDTESKVGISLSCGLEYRCSRNIGCGIELIFAERGFRSVIYRSSESGLSSGKDYLSYRRDILTLAPYATLFVPLSTYIKFGPRIEVEIDTNNDDYLINKELEDKWQPVKIGYSIGIGKDLSPSRIGLFIEATVNFGFSDFYDSESDRGSFPGTRFKIVEHSALLTIGFRI